jgi:hypothetical protein
MTPLRTLEADMEPEAMAKAATRQAIDTGRVPLPSSCMIGPIGTRMARMPFDPSPQA